MACKSPLFLGLDLSTQQLKGVLVDCSYQIINEVNVVFDKDFPDYKTTNGRHANGSIVTAPVYMWVEALDLLMQRVSETGVADRICGISGAAQQHGSVYWSQSGVDVLGKIDGKHPLKDQLIAVDAFAACDSPIWEDSSTGAQCSELTQLVGGDTELARLTGSMSYERFTGAQIIKMRDNESVWGRVARVSLVSSFVASLLSGKISPIDVSDGSGMNLMNIQSRVWSKKLCDSIDPKLCSLLGRNIVMADTKVGSLSPYYTERYGIPLCPVVAFTGDNPSAFVGFESFLSDISGTAMVVSLGTSDTALTLLNQYPYIGDNSSMYLDGHILSHPTKESHYLMLLCYKNGSLARELVLKSLFGDNGSWDDFNQAVEGSQAAPDSFGFYYFMDEIIPKATGVHRFVRDSKCGEIELSNGARFTSVDEFTNKLVDARAIAESQFMSILLDYKRKSHSLPQHIVLTGGASNNLVLRQIISNVFGVPVYVLGIEDQNDGLFIPKTPAMPAYGGSVRAANAVLRGADTIIFTNNNTDSRRYTLKPVNRPDVKAHTMYSLALADFGLLRDLVENTYSSKQRNASQ